MTSLRRTVLGLTAVLVLAPHTDAQRLAPHPWGAAADAPVPLPPQHRWASGEPPSAGGLSLAGAGGAVVGLLAGAYLGYQMERSSSGWGCSCDDPGLEGAIYGMALAPGLTVPVAVHLANDRQGKLSSSLLTSSLIAGTTTLLVAVTQHEATLPLVLVAPALEVWTSVSSERRSHR